LRIVGEREEISEKTRKAKAETGKKKITQRRRGTQRREEDWRFEI